MAGEAWGWQGAENYTALELQGLLRQAGLAPAFDPSERFRGQALDPMPGYEVGGFFIGPEQAAGSIRVRALRNVETGEIVAEERTIVQALGILPKLIEVFVMAGVGSAVAAISAAAQAGTLASAASGAGTVEAAAAVDSGTSWAGSFGGSSPDGAASLVSSTGGTGSSLVAPGAFEAGGTLATGGGDAFAAFFAPALEAGVSLAPAAVNSGLTPRDMQQAAKIAGTVQQLATAGQAGQAGKPTPPAALSSFTTNNNGAPMYADEFIATTNAQAAQTTGEAFELSRYLAALFTGRANEATDRTLNTVDRATDTASENSRYMAALYSGRANENAARAFDVADSANERTTRTAGQAFDLARAFVDSSTTANTRSTGQAFDLAGQLVNAQTSFLGQVLTRSLDSQSNNSTTLANAYNDAKGRGAQTDTVIMLAIGGAVLVALLALRK